MAATTAKDDMQQWSPTAMCPLWESVPDMECLPWNDSLDYQFQNFQPIATYNSCTDMSPQYPNAPKARHSSHQKSSYSPPLLSPQTSGPDSLQSNVYEYCDYPLEYSGSDTAFMEQFPTSTLHAADNNTAVSRSTNGDRTAMGASGAIDSPPRKSKRCKVSMGNESHYFSSSSDQAQRSKQHLRNPQRTCVANRPTSAGDAATTKELANRAHTIVERRYREGLKVKLEQLEAALAQVEQSQTDQEPEKSHGLDEDRPEPGLIKRKKSDLLHDAVSYIHRSEVDMRHLSDEVNRLNGRIRLLEKLVKCEDCPLVKQMSMMRLQAT